VPQKLQNQLYEFGPFIHIRSELGNLYRRQMT
jgi:hypothetical protein